VSGNFAQVGRVAYVQSGANEGKTCVIVNIVDQNRVLVDGPASITGVKRQVLNFKDLLLTSLSFDVPFNARESTLVKAYNKAEIAKQWLASSLHRKIQKRAARAGLTDFQRFQVIGLKHVKNHTIKKAFRKLRIAQGKAGPTAADKKKSAANAAVVKKKADTAKASASAAAASAASAAAAKEDNRKGKGKEDAAAPAAAGAPAAAAPAKDAPKKEAAKPAKK